MDSHITDCCLVIGGKIELRIHEDARIETTITCPDSIRIVHASLRMPELKKTRYEKAHLMPGLFPSWK